MIPLYQSQAAQDWLNHSTTPHIGSDPAVVESVRSILCQVQQNGDAALKHLASQFGETPPAKFQVDSEQIATAGDRLSDETRTVMQQAAANIRAFNSAIMQTLKPVSVQQQGFTVGMDFNPVERVACYVPGGRYPLPSTALMTALTAQSANVSEIVICCPKVRDEILFAAHLAGAKAVYQVGGAQAIGAVTFGTESIQSVDMIVGPGNAYVTEAKRQVQGRVGIDMLAGPSELVVIADADAPADWVALDLLAQAEHDPDSRVYLLTPSVELAQAVAKAIPKHVDALNLPEFVQQSLAGSALAVLPNLTACVEASNRIAPEHLELMVADPDSLKPQLAHYGALFMGYQATVPYGDYLAGPNHTLPTHRTARFSGPLNPLTFIRPQSWMKIPEPVNSLSQATRHFATLEGLHAHAAAAGARLV